MWLLSKGDGGIVAAPSGRVFAIDTQKVVTRTPKGERTIVDFAKRRLGSIATGFLPNGIAVAADGSIYVDTYAGNGWSKESAIAVIGPRGAIRLIWHGG